MKDYSNTYPINTFKGETKKELLKFVEDIRKQDIEKIEEKLEIHNHNSIPNYTDEADYGCFVCIKNQIIMDVLNTLNKG